MATQKPHTFRGRFEHVIYSPPGNIEGAMLTVDGTPTQIVFEPFRPDIHDRFTGLASGRSVVLSATVQGPSDQGKAAHPVLELDRIVTIEDEDADHTSGPAYSGTVVRLNYARHGEPNGVVLDTGDFIHLKPHGFALLALEIGSSVTADGDAHRLITGEGWAVEATVVNGMELG